MLSHRIWRSQFGGDPGIVGREVILDGESHTVIGILPAGEFDRRFADAWMPLAFPPDAVRNFHYLNAIARLKPGVILEQAQAEMAQIAGGIAQQYPAIKKDWGATVNRWVDRLVGPQLRLSLLVLMSAVGAVLLIGCANLANLLLARGALRSREVTIRAALGASRWRPRPSAAHRKPRALGARRGCRPARSAWLMFRGIRVAASSILPAGAGAGQRQSPRHALSRGTLTLLTGIAFGISPRAPGVAPRARSRP